MVHGGVISTVLDEVMAWSLYRHQIWAVTAELTVRYRMPLAVGESTYSVGWKVRRRRRRVDMAAELRRDADGALLAQATAVFIEVSADQADAWRQRYLGERDEVWSMK
jgi:acyl-coenzyme A thioesterase PaaI-like protein